VTKNLFALSFILYLLLSSFSHAGDFTQIEQLIDDGWWDDAHAELTIELKAKPDDAALNFLMGKTCFLLQDWENAEDYFERAVELEDTNSQYHYWLGNAKGARAQHGGILKAPGRAKACKRGYERAIELDPHNVSARFGLLQYLMQAPGFVGGNKDKARIQADSIAYYDTLVGFQAKASIYEVLDEDLTGAEKEFTDAIALDSTNLTPYFWYGYFLARHDRLNEAESLAYRGLAIDSTRKEIYYSLADIFIKKERYDDAIAIYERINMLDSTDMLAAYQIGKALQLADSDLNRAETLFLKYLDSKLKGYWPDKAAAHWNLAMVYDKQGKYDQAKTALEKGLALKPKNNEDEMKELLKQVKKKLK
jgi:tetratricopeptide (TPR) repeat protein